MTQNGKGSVRRPKSVDQKTWDENYEKIFGKKQKNSRTAVDKSITYDRMKQSMREDRSSD